MVSRRKVLQLATGASATALAGCFSGGSSPDQNGSGDGNGTGDGNGDDGPGLEITTVPPSQRGTSTAEGEWPGFDWDDLEEADEIETDTVNITQNFSFEPMIAEVSAGTTVTWESDSRNIEWIVMPRLGIEDSVVPGGSYELTFEEPGVYNYVCKAHSPGHLGRIVVTEELTSMPDDGETDTTSGGTDTQTGGSDATGTGTPSD